jgi:hypothetical protein
MNTPESPRQRSLFWPILLIGVGVILLLSNLNLLSTANLATVAALWPLLLIALGLEIMIGRRSTLVSGLLGLLVVGAVIFIMVAGDRLGLKLPTNEVIQEQFSTPIGQASSAVVAIDIASDPVTIDALSGSTDLIDANITHYGQMEFIVSGESTKNIVLRKKPSTTVYMWGQSFQPTRWDIALSPEVPIELALEGGSGSTNANLSDLQLENLVVDVASGSFEVNLPQSEQDYAAYFKGGSGSLKVTLPSDTDMTLYADGASGSITLRLPADAEYRVEVLGSGSGSLNLPGGLALVQKGDDDEGIWETSGYATATNRILIRIEDIGSGSIHID